MNIVLLNQNNNQITPEIKTQEQVSKKRKIDKLSDISNTSYNSPPISEKKIKIAQVVLANNLSVMPLKTYKWPHSDEDIYFKYKGSYDHKQQRHGWGTLISNQGHKFKGQFKSDKITGMGIYTWPSENKNGVDFPPMEYVGAWVDGKKQGKGYLYQIDENGNEKFIYEGDWKNDRPHGQGKKMYNDVTIYEGEWEMGNRHGKGKMTYYIRRKDEEVLLLIPEIIYEGDWENDKPHGQGTKINESDATIYEGSWIQGKGQGKGKMTYHIHEGVGENRIRVPTNIYEGSWDNNLPNGNGKMIYFTGGIYEGGWLNGKPNGIGTFSAEKGKKVSGQWVNGEIKGEVAVTYPSGNLKFEQVDKGILQDGVLYMDLEPVVAETDNTGNFYLDEWKWDEQPNSQDDCRDNCDLGDLRDPGDRDSFCL